MATTVYEMEEGTGDMLLTWGQPCNGLAILLGMLHAKKKKPGYAPVLWDFGSCAPLLLPFLKIKALALNVLTC